MLSITLEGSPFERGYEHGKRLAAEIRDAIQTYCPEQWLSSPEIQRLNRRLLDSLNQFYPNLVIEMEGISKGSGIELERIQHLNLVAATGSLRDLNAAISNTFTMMCSAIGIADSDAGPIAGKNCDDSITLAPFYLFQTVRPDKEMAYMCISTVGTVWAEAGLNDAGFVLMQTAGPGIPGQDGKGIVCNIAPRPVIAHCVNTEEAVDFLERITIAGWGMGAVLVDANGALAIVEKSYTKQAASKVHDGWAFCTNHFVAPSMQGIPPYQEAIVENSETRYRTLTRLLNLVEWPRTLEGLKSALAYHGDDGFVHQQGQQGIYTNYTCIAVPRARKIWLWDGDPCLNKFQVYRL